MGITEASVSEDNMSKESLNIFVEQLKQKQLINRLLDVVQEEVPLIYNALIGERDGLFSFFQF